MRHLNKTVWPYQITLKIIHTGGVMQKWCNECIGKECVDWYYNNETLTYAFKDEPSLLVFKLTWGKYGN